MEINRKTFTSYEYKELEIKEDIDLQYLDAIQCLGWEVEKEKSDSTHYTIRRIRHIINRVELTRLERHLNSCFNEIVRLNQSAYTYATIISISVGLIGTSFILCSIFAFLHKPVLYGLSFILAVIGIVGWISPYIINKKIYYEWKKKSEHFIEEKYDEIEVICKKALTLLD